MNHLFGTSQPTGLVDSPVIQRYLTTPPAILELPNRENFFAGLTVQAAAATLAHHLGDPPYPSLFVMQQHQPTTRETFMESHNRRYILAYI